MPEVELWAEPVDGGELIRDLVAQIRRFIVLADAAALAVALWIIFAHAHAAAFHSPRLALRSPVHRCGKSTLMRVIGFLVVRKVQAASVTASAMFRTISAVDDGVVVLMIDEFDQVGDQDKAGELIAVVNAGHCKLDAYVIRTVPIAGDLKPRIFDCWAPAVVASNKALPVTWMDRSIVLRLTRKGRGERAERLRDDLDLGFDALASRAARWAADNIDALRGADPALPNSLNDRQCDNWRLLTAIADRAGGDWGRQARFAAVALADADAGDQQALGELLLQDLQDFFTTTKRDRTTSMHLVAHLNQLEGRPWHEYSQGKPITQNQLANVLKRFSIARVRSGSRTLSTLSLWLALQPQRDTCVTGSRMRGSASFLISFGAPPLQTVTPSQAREELGISRTLAVTAKKLVTAPVREIPRQTAGCDGVTDRKGGSPKENESEVGGDFADKANAANERRLCQGCQRALPITAQAGKTYCSDACRKQATRQRGERGHSTNGSGHGTTASVAFMITAAQRGELLRKGIHPLTLRELTPADAQGMLGEFSSVPVNAMRSPEEDLAEMRETLVRVDGTTTRWGETWTSAFVAQRAQPYAARFGINVTAADVDAIKAGSMATFAVRDAIWIALS